MNKECNFDPFKDLKEILVRHGGEERTLRAIQELEGVNNCKDPKIARFERWMDRMMSDPFAPKK